MGIVITLDDLLWLIVGVLGCILAFVLGSGGDA